jgi:hypothetical protein
MPKEGPRGAPPRMDQDILKVLQSIERLLRGASSVGSQQSTFASKAQALLEQRTRKETQKTFKAIAVAGKDTSDAFLGLNKSLVKLNSEVGTTTVSFKALNKQLAKFMSGLQSPTNSPNQQANQGPVGKVKGFLSHVFSPFRGRGGMPSANQQAASIVTPPAGGGGGSRPPTPQSISPNSNPAGNALGRLTNGLIGMSVRVFSAEKVFEGLIDAAQKITSDFIMLSRVGLGSTHNLYSMSLNALKAGMSLKEYTSMLHDNITAVSRASSIDDFDKLISAADGQLAAMGVFGAEARGLQASLAESNVMMGISQKDLQEAISGQIDAFDDLRKSTNMAADEFAKLVEHVAQNNQVQSELLGMNGRERIIRQQELLQIATVGQRLGLAANASQALADALIAQRKASVKDRIEQGGVIRQLGAFLGMGATGERAAQLNLKGRRRTSDEENEFRQLLGNMDEASQQLYQQGTLGTQNVLDHLDEAFGKGGLGEIVKANRPAQLAEESGPAKNNRDFGQHVDKFGQAVGNFLTMIRGFKESVLEPLVIGVGGALLTLFKGPIVKVLSGIGSRLGLGGGVAGVATGTARSVGGAMGAVGGYLRSVQVASAVNGPLSAMSGVFSDAASVISTGAGSIMNGLRIFTEAFAPAAALISGVMELVTGEITEALNPSGGFFDRIGGALIAALSALPQFIIDALGFVFGDSFGKQLQHGFDIFKAAASAAVKTLLSDLIGAIAKPFEWLLPADSKLAKMLRGFSNGLQDSADENFAAMDKLWSNSDATLKSLAADNKKTAETATASTTKATKTMQVASSKFNNVQEAATLSAAGIIGDARAVLASPQVQLPTQVAPAPVNTPVPQTSPAGEQSTASPTSSNNDMLSVLTNMLGVLQETLVAEKRQADNSDAMVQRLARTGAVFDSSEAVADRLLNRGHA